MLTSDTRFVLKELRRLTENGRYGFMTGPYPNSIYVVTGSSREPDYINAKNPFELSQQLDFLISQEYLSINSHTMNLTYQGLHPYKLSLIELRHFLIKSVLIPIAVALATSLITLLLTKVL